MAPERDGWGHLRIEAGCGEMAGEKTLPKTLPQLLVVFTAAWEFGGPPSVGRVAFTVASVSQPPRFKLSRLASNPKLLDAEPCVRWTS